MNIDDMPHLPGIPSVFEEENSDMVFYAKAYAKTYGEMVRDVMKERLLADAMRWRFWKPYMRVAREQPTDWTCWIEINEICFRTKTESVDVFTDSLIAKFSDAEVEHEE